MNKVILLGNLTRDVELRYTPSGAAIAKLGLAINNSWKDKATGETRQETMFIDCDVFGKSAEVVNQYFSKGKKILIEGRLKLDQWQDQMGNNRSKHSVVVERFEFVDSKESSSNNNSQQYNNGFNSGGGSFNQQQNNQQSSGNFNGGMQNLQQQAPMHSLSEPVPDNFATTSTAPSPIEDDEIPF